MIPYDCDALLPIEQRYTSEKYRKLSRKLDLRRLDWGEVVELAAWVRFCGSPLHAQALMHWTRLDMSRARLILEDADILEASEPLLAENLANVDVNDGFLMIKAMNESGWRAGMIPKWVKMSLQEEHHATNVSLAELARRHGLTHRQLTYRLAQDGQKACEPSLIGLSFG